ncbi:hypothetical protein KY290_036896 [Solanum tuberosum]|uniref:At2g35280-like TPR domain-containing protein n=1 Tax=Solanum tuberosum TaxID=4113 RepID=A0ABQ7TU01_SOLTU|nr:hypothetical protein KY290_036896 [Solanum tuberosum]
MDKCVDCGNKEAMYRKGMFNFFRNINPDVALELIDKASKGRHDAATYAFALISLYLGGEYRKHEHVPLVRKNDWDSAEDDEHENCYGCSNDEEIWHFRNY